MAMAKSPSKSYASSTHHLARTFQRLTIVEMILVMVLMVVILGMVVMVVMVMIVWR